MTLLVVDPVCGMRIDPTDAVASVDVDGTTISFCSTACRDAFLRSPDAAIQPGVDPRLSATELAPGETCGDERPKVVHPPAPNV